MSESGKKILKNSFFQSFGALGITSINFLLMIAYARLLGPETFGSFVTSQAQVLVWTLLIDLGLSNGLIGALTAAEGDRSDFSRQGFRARDILGRVLLIRLGGALVGFVAICLGAYLHAHSAAGDGPWRADVFWQDIAFTPHLFALAVQLTAMGYCSYRGRQGLSVITNLVSVGFTAGLALWLASQGTALKWVLLAQSWGGLLMGLLVFMALYRRSRKRQRNLETRRAEKLKGPWKKEAWKALAKDSWPYALTFAAAVLWSRLDQITVSHFLGFEAGGQYALAVRLVAIPLLVASSVSFAIFPDLQRVGRDAPEKISIYMGAFIKFLYRYGILLAAAFLLVVSFLVVPLVPKFEPGIKLLPWFIPGVWAYWLQSFLVNSLFGMRLYREAVMAHVYALILYLLALPWLAHFIGVIGVVIAFNIFALALAFFSYHYACKKGVFAKGFSLLGSFSVQEQELWRQCKEKFSRFA